MKSFKVSNFRLFDEQGVEAVLKPITVLTGSNSSGKSSFVKALAAYSDYVNSTLYDYRRDGSFNPNNNVLDLYRPELKIKGFSSAKNKLAAKDSPVSFTRGFSPSLSALKDYKITHSFNSNESGILDVGHLDSVELSLYDEVFLKCSRQGDKFIVSHFDINHNLLNDFLLVCKYWCIPWKLLEDVYNIYDGSYDPEFFDEDGNFSIEKAAQSERGKLMAAIQGLDIPSFAKAEDVDNLPKRYFDEYKNLFIYDLSKAVHMADEYHILFFFPVLTRFIDKDKDSSISILRTECKFADSLVPLFGNYFVKNYNGWVDKVVRDFSQSNYQSFLDYYRAQENYVLENYNRNMPNIVRAGRNFNFIEQLIAGIDVSFDSLGFNMRNESDTLFSVIYDMLSIWQWSEESKDTTSLDKDYIVRTSDFQYQDYSSRHILFSAYKHYIKMVLTECLVSNELSKFEYNTNSFASVQRLHSFEENSQFVKTMKNYAAGRESLKNSDYVPDTFINKWLGKEGLNICDHIELNTSNIEGLGFTIELVQENGEREQLADVGHGVTQIISLLLQIENAIIQNHKERSNNSKYEINDPVAPSIIAIEEPEVSLHPCYQSMLADMFYDAVKISAGSIQFVIETHSEYLIRKMQAIVSGFSKDEFDHNPFAVYYFNEDGTIKDLGFKESGRFKESFGPGFFDEAASLKYLRIANEHNKNE